MKRAGKHNLIRRQRGISLVETLVAVAILGTAVVTFVVSLSAGALSTGAHERETIAQRLAVDEMEYVKSLAFSSSGTYPTISTPSGYALTVGAAAVPGANYNMQNITVTVLLNGGSIFTLSDYKVNR